MAAKKKTPRVGSTYRGPVAWCDDYALVPRPGYYALSTDGKDQRKPLLRLVAVDDAPGDAEDGAFHYEVAGDTDPVQRRAPNVELEAHLEGHGEVGV